MHLQLLHWFKSHLVAIWFPALITDQRYFLYLYIRPLTMHTGGNSAWDNWPWCWTFQLSNSVWTEGYTAREVLDIILLSRKRAKYRFITFFGSKSLSLFRLPCCYKMVLCKPHEVENPGYDKSTYYRRPADSAILYVMTPAMSFRWLVDKPQTREQGH